MTNCKRLQKCIYKEGNTIQVKKTCYDQVEGGKSKQVTIPVGSVKEGVEILNKLAEEKYDYGYAMVIREKQFKKHNRNQRAKNKLRYIIKQGKNWVIQKQMGKKRLIWKCTSKKEAMKLRDELESKNWIQDGAVVSDVKQYSSTKGYQRFEEVQDLPRLHIGRTTSNSNNSKATVSNTTPVSLNVGNLLKDEYLLMETTAHEYNISIEEMLRLTTMIGLQQLKRLNFIPELEE